MTMYLAALLTEDATDVASPQSTATEVHIYYLLGRAYLWHNMIKTVNKEESSQTVVPYVHMSGVKYFLLDKFTLMLLF